MIFPIAILNSFSGSLPIFSSFIWASVPLVCSFICVVFLCLFIIFLTYCVWGLLSQVWRLNYFFLLVSALLRLVQRFVQALYRWELCWVFVCLFFLWRARLSEVVILSADDWVCIFFCLLFRWSILHRMLLLVGWCLVLYSGGFLCVSSHCLILPRASSLVV